MYTLGGGIHEEQGWGRADETFAVKEELAAYGVEPHWFGLGDRDLATHVVRTQMLDQGYPLSQVTEALCAPLGSPGVRLLPMTDDRVETHVVDRGRAPGGGPCTSRSSGSGCTPRCRRTAIAPVGIDDASPAPGVLEAIADADVVLLPPSNPVVSIGTILAVPGIRDALARPRHPSSGVSPIIGGAPVRGMADACLTAIGRRDVAGRGRPACTRGLLDGWLVDDATPTPARRRPPTASRVRGRPLLMTRRRRPPALGRGPPSTSPLELRGGRRWPRLEPSAGRRACPRCVAGRRPGGAARATHCRRDLRDGDVVVVTSKVVSKAEGRSLAADDREAAIDAETVRVVAARGADPHRRDPARPGAGRGRGRRHQHRARAPCCCCPSTPTPPPAAARRAARARRRRRRRRRHRHRSAGPGATARPTPPIGVAGLAPLDDLRGRRRRARQRARHHRDRGRRRGRRGRRPGQGQARRRAGRRRPRAGAPASPARRTGRAPRRCVRPAGRGHVPARAPRGRCRPGARSRSFTDEPVDRATRAAAPWPRPSPPPRRTTRRRGGSCSSRIPRRANGCSTRWPPQWAPTCARDGFTEEQVARRIRRGDVLRARARTRRAVPGRRRRARLPRRAAGRGRARDVPRRDGRRASRTCWSRWPPRASARPGCRSTMFCRDVVRAALDLPADWDPMGAVAVGRPWMPVTERPVPDPEPYVLIR